MNYLRNSIYFYLFAFLDYASLWTMKSWCIFAAFWKLCWSCLRVLNDDRRNDHYIYILQLQLRLQAQYCWGSGQMQGQ